MSSPKNFQDPPNGPNRRAFLGGGIASLAAAGVGAVAGASLTEDGAQSAAAEETRPGELVYRFHGNRQRGVTEAPQPWFTLIAFDLVDGADRDTVRRLMLIWTQDIARLTEGRGGLTDQEPELAVLPAGLTVTVGWGPNLFTMAGLDDIRPSWAQPLPEFAHDALDPDFTGGDLVLQVAAHSPVTVAHA